MKKLITILLVLLSFVGLAQNNNFPNKPTQGNDKTSNQFVGQVSGQKGVSGGVFIDTIAANNTPFVKSKSFNQIATTSDNNYWYRSSDTMRWVLFATTTSNCAGTQLISGSVTWSGAGLVYDATDLDYYIICTRYFASATTLTLSVADPTFARIDKFYADNTDHVGVITGTPSANPQEPQVNPLTQIDLGFVYVPAGSTIPAGTTQTIIYNENVEWTGTSDVSGIDFASTSSPCYQSLAVVSPTMDSAEYISFQNGSTLNINNQQYLKFRYKKLSSFSPVPSTGIVLSFYHGSTQISEEFILVNGAYGYDETLVDSCQLIVIPLTGITTSDSLFDKLYITNNGAVPTFQLDYIYLLEGASVPPVISNSWVRSGNAGINDATEYVGTSDAKKLNFGTNGQIRAYIDTVGIDFLNDDTTQNILIIDPVTKKISKTYFPTLFASTCLQIFDSVGKRWIRDTCSNGGGSTPGLNAVTLVDSTSEQGIKIATDTAVTLGQATLFADSWGAAYGLPNQNLGWFTLVCNWYGWSINNASLSSSTLMDRVIVDPFGAVNMVDRIPLIPLYSTGDKLIFAYGLNDVRWNGANYTTANFITDYTTILDSCVARGWTGDNIVLVSTGYLSPTSYISYGGNPAATQARQLSFDSCINVLATTYGAKYYDAYTYMANNGGNSLMQFDSVHPNTQGQKVYAVGFINNYNEPVRFGNQKLSVNGLAEFNSIKFTDFPTTNSEKGYEVVLDSAGNLAVSTVQHVVYNAYGNVQVGFNADSIPYKLAVDGSAFIGDGLNIANINATQYNKWLKLFSDYSTGASSIDSYNPTGTAGTQLLLNSNSRGNIKLSFVGTGASTISTGNVVVDSFYSRMMHPVITGFAPARVQGGNLMYFTGNGTIISSNSAASTFDNLSLQGFGGNTNVGKNGTASARLHITAGTATASTAPLKFNAGTNLTTPEEGAIEFDGTDLFYTNSTPTRRTVANLAGTQTFTNKTLTSPVINVTSDATGDMYYRSAGGLFTRLAIGSASQSLRVSGGLPIWSDTLAVSGVYALINANTTGSAATLTTARKINGVDFNGSADISTDMYLSSIQAMGSTIIGYNLDGNPSNGTSVQSMVSQRAYFTAVRLNKAQTVTGVKWIQTTAGDYTANNYNGVGLYSYSGGTLTLVASSTDDGNIWKATANTMASKAFSSTYSAAAGIYFVAFLYSSSAQTTAPALQILGPASATNLILDLTNSAKTSSLLSSQTALPSTQAMSGLSGANTEFKAFIY